LVARSKDSIAHAWLAELGHACRRLHHRAQNTMRSWLIQARHVAREAVELSFIKHARQ